MSNPLERAVRKLESLSPFDWSAYPGFRRLSAWAEPQSGAPSFVEGWEEELRKPTDSKGRPIDEDDEIE